MINVYKTNLSEERCKQIEEGGYWVIPSHREKHTSLNIQKQTVRYWAVEITLTSGNPKQFYIKARNHQEALEKARNYDYLVNLKDKGKWSLLP